MPYEDRQKNILLISDNQIDIRRIEKQLMDTGSMDCRLYGCTTISAASMQLAKKGQEIDLIILDLRLQDEAGPEDPYKTLTENLEEDIPVIVLTGDSAGEQAQADLALAAGASGSVHREQFNNLVRLIGSLVY